MAHIRHGGGHAVAGAGGHEVQPRQGESPEADLVLNPTGQGGVVSAPGQQVRLGHHQQHRVLADAVPEAGQEGAGEVGRVHQEDHQHVLVLQHSQVLPQLLGGHQARLGPGGGAGVGALAGDGVHQLPVGEATAAGAQQLVQLPVQQLGRVLLGGHVARSAGLRQLQGSATAIAGTLLCCEVRCELWRTQRVC